MLLADSQIPNEVLITPFAPAQVRDGVISYGVTSYGYDARIGNLFKVFTNTFGAIIDPKNFNPAAFITREVKDGDAVVIPPNSFVLGETVEEFVIPRSVLAVCLGKSTYARCGLIVNVTPLEPEWRGKVTVEISNTTPLPAKVYAGEGIMQILFFRGEKECGTSYADKKGKYQDQAGIMLPFVERSERGWKGAV